MAYIAQYLNDYLVTKQIDAITDETLTYLRTRSEILTEVAPTKEYSTRNFMGLLTNEVNPVASIVAYGQELPTVSFGDFQKVTAEMAKIGISRIYNEELQWQIYEAMEMANLKGVTVQDQRDPMGNIIAGANQDLAMLLFGSVQKMIKSVMDKFDSMTWQALQTGMVDLTDPRTNIPVKLNFKDPNADYNHFPNPLVATGSPVGNENKWSDYENANGLQNLYDATETYIDTNGYPPDSFGMSRKLLNHLLQQKSTKDAATQVKGSSVGVVSIDLLNAALDARMVPRLKIIDDRYNYEDENKVIHKARFLNENTIVAFKKDAGIRAIGVTMESSPVQIEDGGSMPKPKPGIYVTTYEKQKQPPIDVTLAVMTALPIFLNPKLLYAQVVN